MFSYKGLALDIENIDHTRLADYASISPSGKFPVIWHDGQTISDSTDIAHHLDRCFAQHPLIPADAADSARVHIIEDWADESLYFYAMLMRLGWMHNAQENIGAFASVVLPTLTIDEALERVSSGARRLAIAQGLGRKSDAAVLADVERHVDAVAALVKATGWMVGAGPTLADLAVRAQLAALLDTAEVRELAAARPAIGTWMARVDQAAPDRT